MADRRSRTFDGIEYSPGRPFRVIRPGLRLIGFTPHASGGQQGWDQVLQPGDLLTCTGYGPGWGSDPGYGIEFSTAQSLTAHASHCDIYPHAGGIFDFRPPAGSVEPVENTTSKRE